MILTINGVDITNSVIDVTWSGSYKQAARKLDFNIATSPTDKFFKSPDVTVGNYVEFFDEDKRLFAGYVFTKEKSYQGNQMLVTAYDGAIYLLKNKGAYNFKGVTAEQIATTICNDFNIPFNEFETTGIPQTKTFIDNSLHDIILEAYSKAASQNGKEYILIMINNKLNVVERGNLSVDYTLTNQKDLINSRYTETIENMVNKVKIVDDVGSTSSQVLNWGD
jgi:hypothetical protein